MRTVLLVILMHFPRSLNKMYQTIQLYLVSIALYSFAFLGAQSLILLEQGIWTLGS